jgi:hypothetical protein
LVRACVNLLRSGLSDIKETLTDLHTIFNIENQTSSPIRLHDPTFRCFLLDKSRCSDLDFWVDDKHVYEAVADKCISLMFRMLKADICGLNDPGTLLKDVEADVIEHCIPPELRYVCLYWVEHYRKCGARLTDGDRIHKFFQKHFLHWLKAISLIGKSSEMEAMIRMYHSYLVVGAFPSSNMTHMYHANVAIL